MLFKVFFVFILVSYESILADKDDVDRSFNDRDKLFGRTLGRFPLYPHHYPEILPPNQFGILNGVSQFPLGTNGLVNAGQLINSQYGVPRELFNSQQLNAPIKISDYNLALPQLFNTVKDSTYDALSQSRRQVAARALFSSPAKFSVDDLINLLLIQLLTKYEGNNNPEGNQRTLTKYSYPVEQSLVSNLNQQRNRLLNPALQLSSYVSGINDPRNAMSYTYQKRGRSLSEKPVNPNEFIHKTHLGLLENPPKTQNGNENLQHSLKTETLIPMFKFPNNNVEPTSGKELDLLAL